jgi:uncharacterized ParB-like nuclease family protein
MVCNGSVDDNSSTAIAVVEAVADQKEVDISDIETPLAEVIDPDSLDRLWDSRRGTKRTPNGVLSFDYDGCRVTVTSDGTVEADLH